MNLRSIRSRFLLCKREKHEGEQKKNTRDGGTAGEENDSGRGGTWVNVCWVCALAS